MGEIFQARASNEGGHLKLGPYDGSTPIKQFQRRIAGLFRMPNSNFEIKIKIVS